MGTVRRRRVSIKDRKYSNKRTFRRGHGKTHRNKFSEHDTRNLFRRYTENGKIYVRKDYIL